jgi:hypothetical protein
MLVLNVVFPSICPVQKKVSIPKKTMHKAIHYSTVCNRIRQEAAQTSINR